MNTMEITKLYWDLHENVNGGFFYRNESGQYEDIDDKSGDARAVEDSLQEAVDCDFDLLTAIRNRQSATLGITPWNQEMYRTIRAA